MVLSKKQHDSSLRGTSPKPALKGSKQKVGRLKECKSKLLYIYSKRFPHKLG